MDVVTKVLHILIDNALADHLKTEVHELLTPGYTAPVVSEEQLASARALLAAQETRQSYLASQDEPEVAAVEEPSSPHPSQLPEEADSAAV